LRLIVGRPGQSGPGYAGHRHNIGFMAADEIRRRYGFRPWRSRFHGLVSEGEISGEDRAAEAGLYERFQPRAAAAARFTNSGRPPSSPSADEIELVPGKVRVKQGGGAAGHNGLRSMDAHIGAPYWRVRLGAGHPGHPELVRHYVLQNFAKEEQPLIAKLIEASAEAMPLLVAGDENGFMNKVTIAVNPPKPRPKREDKEPKPID
jgi:PTH1 family peptidyl-tRNA hydrolase